jgi:hypothetical protein
MIYINKTLITVGQSIPETQDHWLEMRCNSPQIEELAQYEIHGPEE